MKDVAYALTVSVVAATHLSRAGHSAWLDACYTEREDLSQAMDKLEQTYSKEPIHWSSGLPCFAVFYFGQILLALAHRRAGPAQPVRIWCAHFCSARVVVFLPLPEV